jgi:uncharacterized transporter YbjL
MKETEVKQENYETEQKEKSLPYNLLGLCLGLVIGGFIGSVAGNITMGICLGVCIGLVVGFIVDNKANSHFEGK